MIDIEEIRVGLTWFAVFYGGMFIEYVIWRLWQWLKGETIQVTIEDKEVDEHDNA